MDDGTDHRCGLGNVVGSLLTGPLLKRFRPGQVLFVTIWIWVLSWLRLVVMPNILRSQIVRVSTFVIASIYLVAQSSYQLSLIPDQLQGRLNSIIRLLITGSQPLGIRLTGLLIQFVGPVGTVLILFFPQVGAGSDCNPVLPPHLRAHRRKKEGQTTK